MGEDVTELLRKYISDAEKELSRLEKQIRKAEAAGIDVSDERKQYEELKRRIERIKFVYLGAG